MDIDGNGEVIVKSEMFHKMRELKSVQVVYLGAREHDDPRLRKHLERTCILDFKGKINISERNNWHSEMQDSFADEDTDDAYQPLSSIVSYFGHW